MKPFFPPLFSTVFLLATSPLAYQVHRLPTDPAKQRVGRVTRGLMGLGLRMGFGGAVKLVNNYTVCIWCPETTVYVGAEHSHGTVNTEPTLENSLQ